MELQSVFGGEDSKKLGYSLSKMLHTLSIDTKTPNIWDFPQKLHSLSIFLQNTLKTRDIQYDFPEKL